jgi:hypothetical protein
VACSDIRCDVGSHVWPPYVTGEDVEGGVFTLVSGEGSVVGVVEEAMTKVFVVGDAETVSVIPQTVSLGERTEAFMYGIAVEWVGPVSSADLSKCSVKEMLVVRELMRGVSA